MSKWLARALAADVYRNGVPVVPFVPVAEPEPANGTNDANGTPLIYIAGEPSEAARAVAHEAVIGEADAPATWREALLGLSPDRDPCPGFRPHAWARVWANALDFIDRHGAQHTASAGRRRSCSVYIPWSASCASMAVVPSCSPAAAEWFRSKPT
jgi:hypothetical protein